MNVIFISLISSFPVYSIYDQVEREYDFIILMDNQLKNRFNIDVYDKISPEMTYLASFKKVTGSVYRKSVKKINEHFTEQYLDKDQEILLASKVPERNELRFVIKDNKTKAKFCIKGILPDYKLEISHSWIDLVKIQSDIVDNTKKVAKIYNEITKTCDGIKNHKYESNEILSDLLLLKDKTDMLYQIFDSLLKRVCEVQLAYVDEFIDGSLFLGTSPFLSRQVILFKGKLVSKKLIKAKYEDDLRILLDRLSSKNDLKVRERYLKNVSTQ